MSEQLERLIELEFEQFKSDAFLRKSLTEEEQKERQILKQQIEEALSRFFVMIDENGVTKIEPRTEQDKQNEQLVQRLKNRLYSAEVAITDHEKINDDFNAKRYAFLVHELESILVSKEAKRQ